MKLLKKIPPDHVVFYILGGFVTIGLFLGDGKQSIVDTLGAATILSLHIFAIAYLEKQRDFPNTLSFLWMINIGYWIIRTIFSDSISYSITTTMRFIMAYLIFKVFYECGKRSYQKYLTKFLIFFSIFAIFLSFFFLLLPKYTTILPPMNLLYPYHGHNHLVNILVIVYPIALVKLLTQSYKTNKQKYFIFVFYFILVVCSIILSFSRGAIVLIGLYTIICVGLFMREGIQKKHIVFIILGCLLMSSFMIFSIASVHKPNIPIKIFERQIHKPLLAEEGRLKYLKQAWKSIQDRPLFGSGPGTFYLMSKRYQNAPNNYSWFAHNSILQWLVELGIIGTALFLGLTAWIVSKITISNPVSHGLFLILFNSLFDFKLDFLIIWLLLWGIIGIMQKKYDKSKHLSRYSYNPNIRLSL